MSEAKSDRELAKDIYVEHKGRKPLIEIAEEIGRPAGTVRGWKSKDKWDSLITGTFQQERNETERSNKKKQSKIKKKKIEDKEHKIVINEVVSNNDLTDKQQLFCIEYLKYFNATKAYQKAYKCNYNTAMVEGHRLLRNPKVAEQIEKLKKQRMEGSYLEGKDILQKYIDIAFADITDYMEFGVEDIPLMDNNTGKQSIDGEGNLIFYQRNYLYFKNNDEVDGTIISEIGQGKDGIKLKLQDKMKALNFLAGNISLLSSLDEVKIESEKAKVQKIQLEIEKLKNQDELEVFEDDGFIDALKGEVSEVWEDEDTEED